MLKSLSIQHLILIDHLTLILQPGFNVLTGETGSGKSAIVQSLALLCGSRADSQLIRRGAEKGIVEGVFALSSPPLLALLEEEGIIHEVGDDLVIRREISLSGKGRILINHQLSSLNCLRRIGPHLAEIVCQHATHALFSLETQRLLLDLYSNSLPLLEMYQQFYREEKALRKQLEHLYHQSLQQKNERKRLQACLDELNEACLSPEEEETLFTEYTVLSHTEQLASKTQEILIAFTGERHPILGLLHRQRQAVEPLLSLDPTLEEVSSSLRHSILELQEVVYTLQRYQSRLERNDTRIQTIDQRLTLLNRLKRKYSASISELIAKKDELLMSLAQWDALEDECQMLEKELQLCTTRVEEAANRLSQRRQESACALAGAVTQELQALNMSGAHFTVHLITQSRNDTGQEQVEFFLRPNLGEDELPLRNGVSGGELSRVLLALHMAVRGRGIPITLVFDEIDANIGGATAAILGEKLRQMGHHQQIICMTHFPQVARHAHHHLRILKEEREGRTLTLAQELDTASRLVELARMSGSSLPPSSHALLSPDDNTAATLSSSIW